MGIKRSAAPRVCGAASVERGELVSAVFALPALDVFEDMLGHGFTGLVKEYGFAFERIRERHSDCVARLPCASFDSAGSLRQDAPTAVSHEPAHESSRPSDVFPDL